MPYGDLERAARAALRVARRSRRGALHGRGARGVRAAPRRRQRGLRRRRLRAPSRAAPSRRPTSSSGTAATTTSRSSARTCTSSWSTRCGPGRAPAIIRARPCCAWPTSWSSTRWTSRRRADVQAVVDEARAVNPRGGDRARGLAGAARRSRRRARPPGARGRGRADDHARRHAATAPATWPPSPPGRDHRGSAAERAAPAMRAVFAQYPHIGPVLPAVGYDAGAARGAARDDRPRRRRRGRRRPRRSTSPRCSRSTSPWCGRATSSPTPASRRSAPSWTAFSTAAKGADRAESRAPGARGRPSWRRGRTGASGPAGRSA